MLAAELLETGRVACPHRNEAIASNLLEHKQMYTIEDARLSRLNPIYRLPEDATREFGRENIIRALESEAQARHEQNVTVFRRVLSGLWQKLTGGVTNRTQSAGRDLPV
jgi:hypothetical protein